MEVLYGILFLTSVVLFLSTAYMTRRVGDRLQKAAQELNNLADAYVQAYTVVNKMIENISLRADNLHSRTNDLEHDVAQHNVLLPLLIEALHINTAKKLLEDSKIIPENFGEKI